MFTDIIRLIKLWMFYILFKGFLLQKNIIIKLSGARYYYITIMFPRILRLVTKSRRILKGNNISNTNEGIVTELKSRMWTRNLIWARSEPKKNWGKTPSIKSNRNSVVGSNNNVILIKLAYINRAAQLRT